VTALVPLAVMIPSGLLLQLKKQVPWVQPTEYRGSGTAPRVDLEAVLGAVKTVTAMRVTSWHDVNRIDVRPDRGVAKVWLRNGWEVQVDLGTGAVLSSAYRRSDVIESLHDGSFFAGDYSKLGLFLPTGIALLLLWATGMWMAWWPFTNKRRVRKRKQSAERFREEAALPD